MVEVFFFESDTINAVIIFYSRIVLKKLNTVNKKSFKKLEHILKVHLKTLSDIEFLQSDVTFFVYHRNF